MSFSYQNLGGGKKAQDEGKERSNKKKDREERGKEAPFLRFIEAK